jgi:hypothetical protein
MGEGLSHVVRKGRFDTAKNPTPYSVLNPQLATEAPRLTKVASTRKKTKPK